MQEGHLQSALDEMLYRRIPIQLGGMTDPFSEWERLHNVTLRILEALNEYSYPTLISTKGQIIGDKKYIKTLKNGNYYIRISITGASNSISKILEHGVVDIRQRLNLISKLAENGLNVSVRLQPLIPGFERSAETLIEKIAKAGARHISVEYLKWPVEWQSHQSIQLDQLINFNKDHYLKVGANRVGREYVLPATFKAKALFRLKEIAEEKGVLFGFADNEFLHFNDFESCCNGADKFLKGANFFKCNILTAVKVRPGAKIFFKSLEREWRPELKLSTYLNSRSRLNDFYPARDEWLEILRQKWNAKSWRGGPESFYGVERSGDLDSDGNVVFVRHPKATTVISKGVA